MCKKEVSCYMGKEMTECCENRVKQALMRRTSIIMLVVAVVLLILALTIKTGDNSIFADQVSFASTITSIILSVIAIWMSISGERQTNEIKEKVVMASDKLSETVNESQRIMNELKRTLHDQNDSYAKIIDGIKMVGTSVDHIESLFSNSSKINSNDYYEIAMNGLSNWQYKDALIECMVAVFESEEDIDQIIRNTCKKIGVPEDTENIIVGIMCVFYHNNFFEEPENEEKVRKYKKS